jgi:bifunctional enzyme CysN/CysC
VAGPAKDEERELLRFLTAGSVDDGKSTLLGRLLHDANGIYEDQLAAVRSASTGGAQGLDFSLVTDGLRAERAQGITIDVAYQYFATPRRKFIIADAPGHEQYTRNMATGASTASLAVLLIDASKGVLPQTRRHAVIAWLLGIRSFAVAVNKMDLVQFDEETFRRVEREFSGFVAKLGSPTLCFVPTCAVGGDNVVQRSVRMPWFTGTSLLEHLESTPIAWNQNSPAFRFPIQFVLRPARAPRRYAGQVASGMIRRGDTVLAMPSGRSLRLNSIRVGDQELECAFPPLSASLAFDEEGDIGRGDMLVDARFPPAMVRRVSATLLWFHNQPLRLGHPYLIKHTTRHVCASVARLNFVLDPTTLDRRPADTLALNEFGEVEMECHQPLYCDPYVANPATGAFILIDPISNETLAAGMIASCLENTNGSPVVPVTSAGAGLTVWLTGLSSAGKTTISQAVYEKLWARGYRIEWLDGDVVRQHLSKGLGFSKEDRDENIRRIGFVAELLTRNGVIVLVSAISPYRSVRDEIRGRIGNFLEVYVHAPLEVCEQRDIKGIYRRARAGEMHGVTGVDDPYEPPLTPEVECHTDRETLLESTERVLEAIRDWLSQRQPNRTEYASDQC